MSNLNFNPQGYEIKKELGRNSQGGRITYLGRDVNLDFPVVIKKFQFADFESNWQQYEAQQREIEILKDLDHPCIPRYLDDFETPQGFCLVQEYIPSASLVQPRHFTPQEVKQIAQGVLEILVYLQDKKPPIFHGNIKPSNILVDRLGTIKVYLVGFGLEGQNQGTLGFMPPEQMFKKTLTPASDLFSLGATLICLLTGVKSEDIAQLIDENYNVNLESLKDRIDQGFLQWLEKMVAPQLKNRYPNAAVALQALKPVSVIPHSNLLTKIIAKIPLKILPPLVGITTLSLAAALSSVFTTPQPPERVFSDNGFSTNAVDRLLTTGECTECNFQGVDLRAMNLEGSILSMSDFSAASLQGVKLQGGVLKFSNFEGANLQGANFQGAFLERSNFAYSNLQGSNLQGANLEESNLQGAFLQGANLNGVSLDNTHLEEVSLNGATLENASLNYTYLSNSFLNNTNFKGANLSHANLESAHLNSANLTNANLENSYLKNANLEATILTNTNLKGTDFTNAYLVNADLRNADLTGAILTGADFRGANLDGAIMPDGRIYQRRGNSLN